MLQALTNKLYSFPSCTISEILEVYPVPNQAKAFTRIFVNGNRNHSSITESVGISSPNGTNLLLDYTRLLVQFQEKLELLQRASHKRKTVESLVSLHKGCYCFWDLVHHSKSCNDPFKECDECMFTNTVRTYGTTANTDREKYIDVKISQTTHLNYSGPSCSHQVSHVTFSLSTSSDSANLCSRPLEQDKNAISQTLLELLPTTKTYSPVTLMKSFLGKIRFWLQTVKDKPNRIDNLLNIMDRHINCKGQRSGKSKQQCTNSSQPPLSKSQKPNMRRRNARKRKEKSVQWIFGFSWQTHSTVLWKLITATFLSISTAWWK